MADEREPPHVCENCRRHWRAQPAAARGLLVVCLHKRLAVRRTRTEWMRLDGINAEEARLLRASPEDLVRRFENLVPAVAREREQRVAVRVARRSTREERLAALFRAAEGA